ncbi:hypothetical protein STRDD11_01773 [Streptococcus sp. DD11]|uniref:DUF2974 domain-containing protein n=1 Tax=Streptococcus sp. DD11 TaxID=1777879 RepID=UPI000791FE39|nr:DUF2974 domain-containing protein [Streptococcus sp. DD11]KXT82700.1 hypothetical protein STRDD11_01773 [Streptococcus sp. DD11]
MEDYINPIDGTKYTDRQHVDISLFEYDENIHFGGAGIVESVGYIGTVSQIYDNVNGHEEQVFVFTNNGQGPKQSPVPYSASDAERAQVQDVTVMMQGSQTKTDTPKLIHDTVTDWLPTDFVTASHRLGPAGAVEYATPFVYRHSKSIITQKSREILDKADRDVSNNIGNAVGIFNKDAGQAVKQSLNSFNKNPFNELRKYVLSNSAGVFGGALTTGITSTPIMFAAGGLKVTQKFPPAQFKDAAKHLKETIHKYPNAKIDLYGHSLGSMDIQYALSTLTEEEMRHIETVHIYNGPNIYPLLTKEQQARLDSAKYKIFNHIDHKDIVSLGYDLSGSENAAGIVRHIATVEKEIGDQHMMEGYLYDKHKNFVLMDGTGKITLKDTIEADMIPYRTIKKQLSQSDGGLSSKEKIYLDSLQAEITAQSLVNATKLGCETLQQARNKVVEEAEKLAEQLRQVPWGFSLSPDEVAAAYQAGGADQDSLVTSLQEHFDNRLAKAKALHETFSDLKGQIQAGIQQLTAADQELAGDFAQWSQHASGRV